MRYWFSVQGRLMDPLMRTSWLELLVKHGYAVIVVERPGTGASFGISDPTFEAAAREADQILDWIAAQPWSNGKIGMYGDSWQGQIQLAAASTGNPKLKALFPAGTWLDQYTGVMYPGGVYNKAFGGFLNWSLRFLEAPEIVTPVDHDKDGTLLAEARRQRGTAKLGEQLTEELFKQYPYEDSTTGTGRAIWTESALYSFIDRVNQSHIPVYGIAGWYDFVGRDMFLIYANLSVPKRLLVRPLDHSQIDKTASDIDYGAEALRWFDYWLKGIDNGIMREAPIHYYVEGAPKEGAWRAAGQWPPDNSGPMRLHFAAGKSGSIASVNDGSLRREPPLGTQAGDAYTVNYATTTGRGSRWTAVNWPRAYPDMRANDEKVLTYTTPPLMGDVTVVGHPIVRLWMTADAPDLDVFVYLEEVGRDGSSTYVTEGNLRASRRRIGVAPFKHGLGLPYRSHLKSDVLPLAEEEPVELVFDLLPTAHRFPAGRRIRIAVAFADADNFDTPTIRPAPKLRLLRTQRHASSVELPTTGRQY
jgi:putative CocE/NonD family hydrolase